MSTIKRFLRGFAIGGALLAFAPAGAVSAETGGALLAFAPAGAVSAETGSALFAFAPTGTVSAELTGRAILIQLTNSTTVVCPIANKPQMTLRNGQITLTSTSENGTWQIDDIDFWKFVDADGIAATKADKASKTDIHISNGTLRITSERPLAQVTIWNAAGSQVATFRTDATGNLTIALNELPHGVSIVKAPGKTIKISRPAL